jgi:putative Holliday junction resolvase
MRILAVDPGSKHIGLAISDPTGTIATPLAVLNHLSRLEDAVAVVNLVRAKNVELIVVGQSLNDTGQPTFEGRRASRFAEALKSQIDLPIIFWDEAFTTRDARASRVKMNVRRKDRHGHLDSIAAVVLLQSYLNENSKERYE